jgi:beta-lactamase regulating signal transducer with metallopeptidase domain
MNPETLRDLLLSLHTASAHAAVLGMLVMALRAILGRNLSPGWRCALWLLVIVRLAWPLHLPSPVSLFNLADPRLSTIASSAIPLSAWKWIALVWAAGAMALFVSVLVDRVRMWWMLRDARPMDSWEAWWLWEQCKTESGLRTPVAILESSQVRSPCLLGSLRPKLLLPKGLSDSFSVEEMRLIFLHELAHLRRPTCCGTG